MELSWQVFQLEYLFLSIKFSLIHSQTFLYLLFFYQAMFPPFHNQRARRVKTPAISFTGLSFGNETFYPWVSLKGRISNHLLNSVYFPFAVLHILSQLPHSCNRTLSAVTYNQTVSLHLMSCRMQIKAFTFRAAAAPVEVLAGFGVRPARAVCADWRALPRSWFSFFPPAGLALRCGHTWSSQEWEGVGACHTPRDTNTHVPTQWRLQPEPVPAQEGLPQAAFKGV